MGNDLFLVLSDPAATIDLEVFNSYNDNHIIENLEVDGLMTCRRYALRRIRGEEYPARFRFASIYEVDRPREELVAGLRERSERRVRPDWQTDVAMASHVCQWLDGGPDPTAHDQLFFVFSTPPPSMTFDQYNEWYREHMQENIRASARLLQGWRYHVTGGNENEVPQHLALYELDGSPEEMLADTNRAVEAGTTGMIEGFHAFCNFDAHALGERQVSR